MASPLRFGLEIELHGIRLTFRQRGGGNNWWAQAVGAVTQEQTMIGLESILVPSDPGLGFMAGGNIQWESNWGFRGVGDAHASMTLNLAGYLPQIAGFCILELATAAAPVDDHASWISSRQAAKAFVAAMDFYKQTPPFDAGAVQDAGFRWFPLQSLLDNYNNRVQNILHLPARFELDKSPSILAFEAGGHPQAGGHQWDAFVSFWDQDNRWADVQVNYQLSVRTLSNNLDAWIASWSSIWAQATLQAGVRVPVDPAIGDAKPAPTIEMYRTQTYAAMWRRAKEQVDAHFIIPASAGMVTSLIKGLLTYLLVASSITIAANGNATQKNSFPQLPKTSPVSIARAILAMHPLVNPAGTAPLAPFFARLAQLAGAPPGPPAVVTTPPGAAAAPLPVDRALLISLEQLRRRTSLTGAPGNLPTTPPLITNPPMAPFSHDDGGLLAAAFNPANPAAGPGAPAHFRPVWGATFDAALPALNAANRFGYENNPTWHCAWAAEVNSSLPATAYQGPGAPAGLNNEIKMLFESRYGRCKLNVGFNPYHSDFLFNRSYKSILRALAGMGGTGGAAAAAAAAATAAAAAVDAAFPDTPAVVQLLPAGAPIH